MWAINTVKAPSSDLTRESKQDGTQSPVFAELYVLIFDLWINWYGVVSFEQHCGEEQGLCWEVEACR